ncbi:MAG: hypothetical protein U0166_27640 [Acidobacteriota bacterium]
MPTTASRRQAISPVPYAMPLENERRITIWRGLRVPVPTAWRMDRHFI